MFHMYKGRGYVRDVFRTRNMRDLLGNVGIGALPLSDRGSAFSELESQPFYVNSPFGITLGAQRQPDQQRSAEARAVRSSTSGTSTPIRDTEVLLNVLALELERAARITPARPRCDLPRGRRRAPALPRRVRRRRDDRRLRDARVPRSVRHPAADHRRQRGDGRHRSIWSRPSRSRSSRSASRCCATSRRARRSSSTRPARFHARQCAEHATLQPVHLRVRLSRAAGFGDRRHVGVRGAAAAWASSSRSKIRGIPQAQDIDVVIPIPDSSRPSALRAREHARAHVSRRLRQEPLHRPHVHHAGPGDAQEERAPEAQSDRHGVQGQGRAARRRFDRPRHDVARDRADGARSRRAQGTTRQEHDDVL